jgi:hypothetical protein
MISCGLQTDVINCKPAAHLGDLPIFQREQFTASTSHSSDFDISTRNRFYTISSNLGDRLSSPQICESPLYFVRFPNRLWTPLSSPIQRFDRRIYPGTPRRREILVLEVTRCQWVSIIHCRLLWRVSASSSSCSPTLFGQKADTPPAECKKCGKILTSFVDPRQAFGPDKIIPPQILANAKVHLSSPRHAPGSHPAF